MALLHFPADRPWTLGKPATNREALKRPGNILGDDA